MLPQGAGAGQHVSKQYLLQFLEARRQLPGKVRLLAMYGTISDRLRVTAGRHGWRRNRGGQLDVQSKQRDQGHDSLQFVIIIALITGVFACDF